MTFVFVIAYGTMKKIFNSCFANEILQIYKASYTLKVLVMILEKS
jgi:hypothetical protein